MYNPGHLREDPPPLLPAGSSTSAASYHSAFEELFGPGGHYTGRMKAVILAHPLFQQLLAAHVACLRVATPLEQQHVIDSALSNCHHVAAKYLALVSPMQTTANPASDQELNHFMVEYILLLQSFKEQLEEHLKTQASEAITACQEIERALFNLTGATSSVAGCVQGAYNSFADEDLHVLTTHAAAYDHDEYGMPRLGINSFLPHDIHKTLRDHMRQELKRELNKDYSFKLKEVRDEILRKRRAGKLPNDTSHVLKDWWISHSHWPYPTEEEKVQLMEETGLELKQINNWFINQRKRNWQSERLSTDATSETINTSLTLDADKVENE